MAALVNAETGYDTVGDFTDTTPQPDYADSLTSLFSMGSYGGAVVSHFTLTPGIQLSESPAANTSGVESWGVLG